MSSVSQNTRIFLDIPASRHWGSWQEPHPEPGEVYSSKKMPMLSVSVNCSKACYALVIKLCSLLCSHCTKLKD